MDVDFPICDDEEKDQDDDKAEPSVSNLSEGFDHIRCIIDNKIQLIGDHPLKVMICRTFQKHIDAIMKMVFSATRKENDDIDEYWIRKQVEFHFAKDNWERIYNLRSYLLEFARYAALEGQVQKVSDNLRARQYRMLRVDEVGISGRERGSKRSYCDQEIMKEEDDSDPFLKDFSCHNSPFTEEYFHSTSNAASDISQNFNSSHHDFERESEQQEDLNRRHKLRAQISSSIGFVSALGKGSTRVEEWDYSAHCQQRKKRMPVEQLNHSQNNIPRRNLDMAVAHSACTAQRAVIQMASCGLSYESSSVNCGIDPCVTLPKRSCLKRTKRKKGNKGIEFAEGINFDKIPCGMYVILLTRERTGQNRTNFISLSFDSLSIDSSEIDDHNGICLPNCDMQIRPSIRENPSIHNENMLRKIKGGITADFYLIMKRAFFSKKVFSIENENEHLPPMSVSRLLITDSMLSSLNSDIFRNMDLMKLDYPRMPMWFLETLEKWFGDDKLKFTDGGVFLYSKVFISLGLDLLFYYADPKGEQIDLQLKFLSDLAEWFKSKVEIIRKFVNQRQGNMKFELFYKKNNRDGYDIVSQFKIVQIPTFVIITTPEIGGWKRYFAELNRRLREFVQEPQNSHFFDLLDWAQEVKKAPPECVKTVADRAALLANLLHKEHGVFYV